MYVWAGDEVEGETGGGVYIYIYLLQIRRFLSRCSSSWVSFAGIALEIHRIAVSERNRETFQMKLVVVFLLFF